MKEIIVCEREAGQRLDKFLARYLTKAPKSFLYKMLRKKNITLNGKKAGGNELVQKQDRVCIFLSDDTYQKFAGEVPKKEAQKMAAQIPPIPWKSIVYEDEHVLLINKPAGMLSQKSRPQDISANERILSYLLEKGAVTAEELQRFRPSVCNRLDRNTSGLLAAGKTLAGARELSKLFRERGLHKYYLCLTAGRITDSRHLKGFLHKNEKDNRVRVADKKPENGENWLPIETRYTPLWSDGQITLLEVWLITGRSHQIRAHLASEGHPILGDPKYGSGRENEGIKKKYGVSGQLLHAWRMVMPEMDGALERLSKKEVQAPLPEEFLRILRDHGYTKE